MKNSIIIIMLLIGLTNNIQAGSLLEPILEILVKGTGKVISIIIADDSNETNQTQKEN